MWTREFSNRSCRCHHSFLLPRIRKEAVEAHLRAPGIRKIAAKYGRKRLDSMCGSQRDSDWCVSSQRCRRRFRQSTCSGPNSYLITSHISSVDSPFKFGGHCIFTILIRSPRRFPGGGDLLKVFIFHGSSAEQLRRPQIPIVYLGHGIILFALKMRREPPPYICIIHVIIRSKYVAARKRCKHRKLAWV
jgi:hypothetical protein